MHPRPKMVRSASLEKQLSSSRGPCREARPAHFRHANRRLILDTPFSGRMSMSMLGTMTDVTLNPEQERFAADAVAQGRYRDLSEVVRAGVSLLQRAEAQRAELLASVRAAETEGEQDGFLGLDEVEASVRAVIARRSAAPA